MIGGLLHAAHRLDNWLRRHFGRPYHAILGIGLVIEIARHVRELTEIGKTASGIIKLILAVILFTALLVHQLGELSEHAARRRRQEIIE